VFQCFVGLSLTNSYVSSNVVKVMQNSRYNYCPPLLFSVAVLQN